VSITALCRTLAVEGLGKVQCVHDNTVVGLKEAGDGVEEISATVVDAVG